MNSRTGDHLFGAALLVVACPVLPGCSESGGPANPAQELAAFERQVLDDYLAFEEAQEPSEENGFTWEEYYAHLFDPRHNPRALAIDWLEEFEVKHRGTQVGFDALHAALEYLCYLDYDQSLAHESSPAYYDLLVAHYTELESLGDVCYLGILYEDCEDFLSTLELFIAKSPHRAVQARAIAAKMQVFMRTERFEDQVECAELLIESYPDVLYQNTPCSELAADSLLPSYSEGLLQVGSRAPEIAGYDLDGERVALSELRGKVVVMSFFGFW